MGFRVLSLGLSKGATRVPLRIVHGLGILGLGGSPELNAPKNRRLSDAYKEIMIRSPKKVGIFRVREELCELGFADGLGA